jgi:hypothetical protein
MLPPFLGCFRGFRCKKTSEQFRGGPATVCIYWVLNRSAVSLTHSVKHRGTKRPTYYKRELDRALWERAQSRCEFIDEKTGRRCDCRFGLQREHVIPLALGGANDLSNMQLLCATHNQLRARHVFGNKKIDAFQTRSRKSQSEAIT